MYKTNRKWQKNRIFVTYARGARAAYAVTDVQCVDKERIVMKKLLCCWALLATLLAACSSDEEQMPVFVTDVVFVSEGNHAPGDELTLSAQGLQADDDVLFDIRWSSQTGASADGAARGVYAVVTARSATGISFLAPGGYPASEVEVLLKRQGRMQPLGRFACSDGQAPESASLYGLVRAGAEDTLIERLDLQTGERTPVALLSGYGMGCAVNDPGSNRIYGLCDGEAGERGLFYDLTMHCVRDSDPERYAAVGRLPGDVAYLRCRDNELTLSMMAETRALPVQAPCWTLPVELTAGMLGGASFVGTQDAGALLLAADLGDGTFAPVVLLSTADGCSVAVGEPVRAAALVPFNRLERDGAEKGRTILGGGYVLSAVDGRTSELRPFDVRTMEFGEPFATIDGPVLSVAVDYDSRNLDIYCLVAAAADAGEIRVYDSTQQCWRVLPGERLPYSEIVLAR